MLIRWLVVCGGMALSACSALQNEPERIVREDFLIEGAPIYPGRIEVRPAQWAPDFDWATVADSVLYPQFAQRARIEETVVLDVVVAPDGRAVSATPLADDAPAPLAPHNLLVEASVMGLRAALYRPAPRDTVRFRLGVSFRLVRPGAG